MKYTATLFLVLILAACGFTPMYGTGGGGSPALQAALSDVAIDSIPDREGQMLRNLLIDRFYTHGEPQNAAYIVKIAALKEKLTDLDITKTSDTTRAQLRIDTHMELRDLATGETVLERKLQAITSYDKLGSEFTNRVSEENARRNAIEDLARQVELQTGLYFRR